MKIFNIDGKISSNLLTNLRSFNEIFMKNASYDNIKNKRKQDITMYLEDTFLEKPQRGTKVKMLPLPPSFL